MKNKNYNCPLCSHTNTSLFSKSENRLYYHCPECDLVFVPSHYFITQEAEKTKYDNHQNSISNKGYVNFLNRLLTPLEKYLRLFVCLHHIARMSQCYACSKAYQHSCDKTDCYKMYACKNPVLIQQQCGKVTECTQKESQREPEDCQM